MKIVVVDDEALLVKGIRFNLQNEGYEVLTGSNGLEAVELARDPEVGLMILDVMMPEMDGLEATRRIRAMDRPDAKTVPIIAMTANAFSDDIQRSREAGVNEHLSKPLDLPLLLQAIHRCLHQ